MSLAETLTKQTPEFMEPEIEIHEVTDQFAAKKRRRKSRRRKH